MRLSLIAILFCLTTNAGTMRLGWTGPTNASAYRIYAARDINFITNALEFNFTNINQGTISSPSLTSGKWYVAATAFAGNIESDFSTVTNFTVPDKVTLKLVGSPSLDFSNKTEFFRLEIGE